MSKSKTLIAHCSSLLLVEVLPINLFSRFVATGAFSGYSPAAPGSAGSLVGLVLYLLLPVAPVHPWIAGLLLLFIVDVTIMFSS